MTKQIEIYDTTLRDGTQDEAINFTVADKCRIAEELDAPSASARTSSRPTGAG